MALGCKGLTLDADRVIAIETRGTAFSVAVGDTVRLTARALNALGSPVSGAVVTWAVIDTGAVGFTLDGASGLVRGTAPGGGRVQAAVENLRSDPLRITVTAPTPVSPDPHGTRNQEPGLP